MTEVNEKGTCRCGATRIQVALPPIMTAACHCKGCQRMSASAFSLTAMVPVAGFSVVEGAPVRGGAKSPGLEHYVCPDCATWMFTRVVGPTGEAPFVNVRPTLFDVEHWCDPFIETMTDEKISWATTPARHRFARFPVEEELAPLMTEFAAARR